MGTISARKRLNGTTGYTAQIRLKRDGKVVHSESNTFDRRPAAVAWLKKRETELAVPGAIERAKISNVTLADVIDTYTSESKRAIGRTKEQVLKAIKTYDIAEKDCGAITSADIVAFAQELSHGRKPQTVANYVSHLAAIFAIARPAWNYPLDQQAMRDAIAVLRRLGTTSKSRERNRRPSLEELDKLLTYFSERSRRAPRSALMHKVIGFALFSTRRQDEIVRMKRADVDVEGSRVLVRDMKHPGQKIGNDAWCELPAEALAILKSMPGDDRVFPYSTDAISASFTRACQFLDIDDLHFHDLRHEGISRLFELGRTVPQVASVSGHRSWQSLQRYTHLRQVGDRYDGWKWSATLAKVDPAVTDPES